MDSTPPSWNSVAYTLPIAIAVVLRVADRLGLGLEQPGQEHQRAEDELRGEALQDQPHVGPPAQDHRQVGAADPVLVLVAGGEHRGQLRLALAAADVVGEQVGHRGGQRRPR